jgi:hypothetical protein
MSKYFEFPGPALAPLHLDEEKSTLKNGNVGGGGVYTVLKFLCIFFSVIRSTRELVLDSSHQEVHPQNPHTPNTYARGCGCEVPHRAVGVEHWFTPW